MTAKGITLLGLGPGSSALLTREAWDWLAGIDEIYLRTAFHPCVMSLPEHINRHSFDQVYELQPLLEDVFEVIITTILELGQQPEGVTYAVPGHPFVAEETCPEIFRRAKAAQVPVRVIEGLSFLEPTFRALELDPFPQISIVDAMLLNHKLTPTFSCSQPALIAQIYSREIASDVKLTLMENYPDSHQVKLVHAAGTPEERIENLPLHALDHSPHIGMFSSLYLPPLPEGSAFEDFQEIIARLRAPDGCPWDREQTHASLKPYMLEEAYEALEALDEEDMESLKEELGDVLLQVFLHAQIATEDQDFKISDVVQVASSKLIRRHPHVFGETAVQDVEGVIQNWERIKAAERQENDKKPDQGMLDGIPLSLPALTQADAIQRRARRVGFDWPDISGVIQKIYEELDELKAAPDSEARRAESGDLLFAVVNLIRWLDIDSESALRECNKRFRRRFSFIEHSAAQRGVSLASISFEEMDALWEQAKTLEDPSHNPTTA